MANKLELTWYGKERTTSVEPRILIENPNFSNTSKTNGHTDNILIHGDNLLALKALESDFAGKIKCIYIDPPYNTGAAFEKYDDNLAHSKWLDLMKPRLELLRKLLKDDGLIFVQIDDNEQAYLTVLMDEIFGRDNRINTICIKMSEASGVKMAHTDKRLPKLKEYILVYCKNTVPTINVEKIKISEWNYEYKNILTGISDSDISYIKSLALKKTVTDDEVNKCNLILKNSHIVPFTEYEKINKFKIDDKWKYDNAYRIIEAVGSSSVFAMLKQVNRLPQEIMCAKSQSGLLYFLKTDVNLNSKQPRVQIIFADWNLYQNPGDLWLDIKTTGGVGQEGGVLFTNSKKPEKLIKRIIGMCTKEGDLVLDSFLGSGTTCAVAHKMKRRWIGIEMGDHAYSHCKKRLDSVIEGKDATGITKEVNWQGGGGYKFYELAPTLINIDAFGQPVINKEYSPDMLAAAVALHEGFRYEPSGNCFWKQSKNDNNTYLYVTTNHVGSELINKIKDEMKGDEFLIISCRSFESRAASASRNITIKKIPLSLLKNCEFGKDNYNLNIIYPPKYDEDQENE